MSAEGGKREGGQGFRRREVLVFGGAITAAGAIVALERPARWAEQLLGSIFDPNPSLTVTLLRPLDFLELRFRFFNLGLQGGVRFGAFQSPPRLVRAGSETPVVVVEFAPQTLAERAFWEASPTDKGSPNVNGALKPPSGSEDLISPPVDARLAGPSRLAFELQDGVDEIPFTDEALLNWAGFFPRLADNAGHLPAKRPNEPAFDVTAIEFPWRLFISPGGASTWAHATTPQTRDGRTELWHTRLAWRSLFDLDTAREGASPFRDVRAIWATGMKPGGTGALPDPDTAPFRMALNDHDRHEIVHLSSNPEHPKLKNTGYKPQRIKVNRLMLSTLGAWADLSGDFRGAPNTAFDTSQWIERATMGREHYARVVKNGYLFPFGHRASLIQVTERKLQKVEKGSASGQTVAFLRKRAFLVVKEPVRSFAGELDIPFESVRILTTVTSDLDVYDGSPAAGTKVPNGSGFFGEKAFWPQVGGADILFSIVAIDPDARRVEFTIPLIFMLASTGDSLSDVGKVSAHYAQLTKTQRYARPLRGQRVAYAESSPGKEADASFETDELQFGSRVAAGSTPKFMPTMRQASLRLPGLAGAKAAASAGGDARAAQGPADQLESAVLEYSKAYLDHGFDTAKNAAQSYLKVPPGIPKSVLDYGAANAGDLCGAIAQPNAAIQNISRLLGPTGGLPDFSAKSFSPAALLDGAKFMGIDFAKVLLPANVKEFLEDLADLQRQAEALAKLPRTLTETVYDEIDALKDEAEALKEEAEEALKDAAGNIKNEIESRIPKEIRTELNFEPVLMRDPTGVFNPRGTLGNPEATLKLHALSVTPLNPPREPNFEVTGDLRNFDLEFFGSDPFLIVHFNRLSFDARKGQKPKVEVDISDVEFKGALSFVNELRELMNSPGNGLTIDVSAEGIHAGYTVGFPSFTVGVFTLANISFAGAVSIPFNGEAVAARFAFCSREQPFLLSYTIFGGGGYAEIEVGAHGVESLKAALEFGGASSMDLGVASGSLQIMAGVYFEMNGPEEIKLGGFVRMNGELDVLGLINATLEFYLVLAYDVSRNEAWGQATLTVEVDVLLYSGSVSVSVEKRFGGGANAATGSSVKASAAANGALPASQPTFAGATPTRFGDLISEEVWQEQYAPAFSESAF